MELNYLNKITQDFVYTELMPVLFLGHGSPMNAIEDNEFVEGFRKEAKEIPKPRAIICISAHWETKGTFVTAMQHPRTIHDFGGFPQSLFDVQYPAPGDPVLANDIKDLVKTAEIGLDETHWGLDHGAWSVIKHLYPDAEVPVIELSLDYTKTPQYHYELAKELSILRRKGVLIIGSGNLVHNLRRIAWDQLHTDGYGYDWALEANHKMVNYILENNHQALLNFNSQGKEFDLAIPTPEHYIPLLYTLGMQDSKDEVSVFNNKAVGGSLTMTSVKMMPL